MPFLISLALGVVLTPMARWSGRRLGLVDRPGQDELKIHDEPIPLLGGAATTLATFLALAVLGERVPWAIPAAAGFALVVGLIDDLRPLPPLVRLGLQGMAGATLVVEGAGLDHPGVAAGIGVIVLVVVCANAVNITDGQDGLAGGLACLASLGLASILARGGDGAGASLGLALSGGLAAFLLWNRPPASIYLGDGGAYAAGALLAVLAVRAIDALGVAGLLAAGACLGVFAFEMAFSVGRRIGTGARITGGDRFHSYDLVASRWGRPRSTVAFWALGIACAVAGWLVSAVPAVVGAAIVGTGILLAAWVAVWLWRRRTLPLPGLSRAQAPDDDPT